jgi:hypothetical protein
MLGSMLAVMMYFFAAGLTAMSGDAEAGDG